MGGTRERAAVGRGVLFECKYISGCVNREEMVVLQSLKHSNKWILIMIIPAKIHLPVWTTGLQTLLAQYCFYLPLAIGQPCHWLWRVCVVVLKHSNAVSQHEHTNMLHDTLVWMFTVGYIVLEPWKSIQNFEASLLWYFWQHLILNQKHQPADGQCRG